MFSGRRRGVGDGGRGPPGDWYAVVDTETTSAVATSPPAPDSTAGRGAPVCPGYPAFRAIQARSASSGTSLALPDLKLAISPLWIRR